MLHSVLLKNTVSAWKNITLLSRESVEKNSWVPQHVTHVSAVGSIFWREWAGLSEALRPPSGAVSVKVGVTPLGLLWFYQSRLCRWLLSITGSSLVPRTSEAFTLITEKYIKDEIKMREEHHGIFSRVHTSEIMDEDENVDGGWNTELKFKCII